MKISDILTETLVVPELSVTDKEQALRRLAATLCAQSPGMETAADEVFAALWNRERLGSTGVGEGVAIPHAKIPGLKRLVACFGRAGAGIPFDAIDQQPVNLIFVLLVPDNSAGAHLKALARISRLLKDAEFRRRLLAAGPEPDGLFKAFIEEDDKH